MKNHLLLIAVILIASVCSLLYAVFTWKRATRVRSGVEGLKGQLIIRRNERAAVALAYAGIKAGDALVEPEVAVARAAQFFGAPTARVELQTRWRASFGVDVRDLWVGVFWKRKETDDANLLHVYVCVMTLVLHLVRETKVMVVPAYDGRIDDHS